MDLILALSMMSGVKIIYRKRKEKQKRKEKKSGSIIKTYNIIRHRLL